MTVFRLITKPVDVDVYDDYDERCALAVVGPVQLTEEGEWYFDHVLDLKVDYYPDRAEAVVHCEDGLDAQILLEFIEAAAGYCSERNYNKWFKEVPDAETTI